MSDDLNATPELVVSATLIAVLGVLYFYIIFYMYKEYNKKRRRTFDVDEYKSKNTLISSNIRSSNGIDNFSKKQVEPIVIYDYEELKTSVKVIESGSESQGTGNSTNPMHNENEAFCEKV